MDNLLPDGTGRDVVEFLKEKQKVWDSYKIPVVSMSGNNVEDQKIDYCDYNITAFFQKPLRSDIIKGLASLAK